MGFGIRSEAVGIWDLGFGIWGCRNRKFHNLNIGRQWEFGIWDPLGRFGFWVLGRRKVEGGVERGRFWVLGRK